MTLAEIEQLINGQLPPAAFKHRAWWSNNPLNNVMTQEWLDAGYKTKRVDMPGRKVVFVLAAKNEASPASSAKSLATTPSPSRPAMPPPGGFLARLCERLAGTVTIPAGVDLAASRGETWVAEQ